MDYLIPIVNGIDCVRIFRKKNKNTPVIMLTAYASEQTKAEAFVAGCNEYILKPIYPAKIFFLLKKYLSKTYETDLSKKHPGRETAYKQRIFIDHLLFFQRSLRLSTPPESA